MFSHCPLISGGMWRRPGSEDIQQKAAKGPGFAGELLQVGKWQNQNLRHRKVREEGKERGQLETPQIIRALTLHPALTPSPPAQSMVSFAWDPHQSSWEQILWSTTGSITSCSLSALPPPAAQDRGHEEGSHLGPAAPEAEKRRFILVVVPLDAPPSPLLTTDHSPASNIAGIVIGQDFSLGWERSQLHESVGVGGRVEVQQGNVKAETGHR